jgi:pyruvate dehydrogenase E2 component (dihydrolipoamide acetyltransferase)
MDFKLPDLGEGLPDGEIVRWTVSVGDTVKVNDVIAEVETVKAAVELPSPYAGVVTALLAHEGETVPVGTAIISIETDAATAGRVGSDASVSRPEDPPERPLVGYGAVEQSPMRRRNGVKRGVHVESASAVVETAEHRDVLAKPPVRKLAKDLGVELQGVAGTGPNGTVTRDDIRRVATYTPSAPAGRSDGETRIPVKGIRKRTAEAMVASAFTAPHVSLFKTIDISATMELRDRVAARREFAGLNVSPLLFVAKAVLLAAARTPEVNATWDESNMEIVLHGHVNLGIAAATERGLIVPNIKDAHDLSLLELAEALSKLAQTAREGRATPADLTGGTFTITNIGVFGVDAGTPILNPGESAILAFGSIERRPWVVGSGEDERIAARWVTQLGVSFDHRIVDGEQGARFLRDVADVLSDPGLALL